MKIHELQPTVLAEGFLDNLITKVQNMAGGDGVTGVIRALRGQNASLNKFADAIAGAVTPAVTQRLGNRVASINDGSSATPVGVIFKQALNIGSQIASRDNIEVTPTEVSNAINTNKEDILRMLLNGDYAADDAVRSIYQTVVTGAPEVKLRTSLSDTIRAIAFIVAGTIIFVSTSKEDAGPVALDPAIQKQFEDTGEQLNTELFDPTSADLRALQPDEELQSNLEDLVTKILGAVKDKYMAMPADKFTELAASPPQLVSPVMLKSLLVGHNPNVPAQAAATMVGKVTPLIQTQFKLWLTLAAQEAAGGASPKTSYELYHQWARDALELVDNMHVGKQPGEPAKPTAPGETPTSAAETEFDSLEGAHDSATDALRVALKQTPSLSPSAQQDIYKRAVAAYKPG